MSNRRVSRIGAHRARTGLPSRGGNGGNMVSVMKYEVGETKRLIFPILVDENGEQFIPRFGEPIHPVVKGFANLVSSKGKPYSVYEVRCMHPFSQVSSDTRKEFAEKKCKCAWCMLDKFEKRKVYQEISEQFPDDTFKDLSDKEKRAVYEELQKDDKVEASYFYPKDSENRHSETRLKIMTLALELEMELVEGEEVRGKKGRSKLKPIFDEKTGLPKYKPVLVPMSKSRENKLIGAVDAGLTTETIEESDLSPIFEGEGDFAEEVDYGFLDIGMNFPNVQTRTQAGKDATFMVMKPKTDNVVTKELIEHVQKNSKKLLESAERAFFIFNQGLEPKTFEDQLNMMADGGEYYREMEAKYAITSENVEDGEKTDDEEWEEVWSKVLNGFQNSDKEDESEEVSVEEETEKVAEKRAKNTTKAKKAPSKAVEETKEEKLEEVKIEDTANAEESFDIEDELADIDAELDELEDLD